MEDYKKYENALARAKEELADGLCYENLREAIRHIFPKLAESEDEKIMNALIKAIEIESQKAGNGGLVYYGDFTNKDVIAWLKKQGGQKLDDKAESIAYSYITPNPKFFQWIYDRLVYVYNENPNVDYMLSLKKRIEDMQKPTDKVESRFNVGDWVVNNNGEPKFYQVTERSWPDSMIKRAEDKLEIFINTATLDKQYHLWTIQDAKDGDVLISPATSSGDKECPFIFKEIDESGIVRFHTALLQSEKLKVSDGIINVIGYANAGYHIPATKEQRDLLFKKMKEAGYEWDAELKQLKKIEQKSAVEMESAGESLGIDNKIVDECIEWNPAWSEEDDCIINNILCICDDFKKSFETSPASLKVIKEDVNKIDTWLKSLKDRCIPQQKQECSEKDEKPYPETLENAIDLYYFTYGNGNGGFNNLSLEKFKDVIKTFVGDYGKLSKKEKTRLTKQIEWGDEEKELLEESINLFEQANQPPHIHVNGKPLDFTRNIKFLKSLKDRYAWKPSDEQIRALASVCCDCNIFNLSYLDSLYQDLKKLKGE